MKRVEVQLVLNKRKDDIAKKLDELGGVKTIGRVSYKESESSEELVNEIEDIVFGVCSQVFGNNDLNEASELFEMGDSIFAGKVITQLKKDLGIKLTIRDLFNAPSIADLSRYIFEKDNSGNAVAMAEYIEHIA